MSKKNLNKLLTILNEELVLSLENAREAKKGNDERVENLYKDMAHAIQRVLIKYKLEKTKAGER